MALAVARAIVAAGGYDPDAARRDYVRWLDSGPFDWGSTVRQGLRGRPNPESQANGALMRISPLGIFGSHFSRQQVSKWAWQDAGITHPHPVCRQANSLFACAIAHAIRTGCAPAELYREVQSMARELEAASSLIEAVEEAADCPPPDYCRNQGWVLIAFRNALWQLLHAPSLEDAVVDTVMRGGDTDTNAAICGALLGAVYGREAIPDQWRERLLSCRPAKGRRGVRHPRPREYWSVDALELAERLLQAGCRGDAIESP